MTTVTKNWTKLFNVQWRWHVHSIVLCLKCMLNPSSHCALLKLSLLVRVENSLDVIRVRDRTDGMHFPQRWAGICQIGQRPFFKCHRRHCSKVHFLKNSFFYPLASNVNWCQSRCWCNENPFTNNFPGVVEQLCVSYLSPWRLDRIHF